MSMKSNKSSSTPPPILREHHLPVIYERFFNWEIRRMYEIIFREVRIFLSGKVVNYGANFQKFFLQSLKFANSWEKSIRMQMISQNFSFLPLLGYRNKTIYNIHMYKKAIMRIRYKAPERLKFTFFMQN